MKIIVHPWSDVSVDIVGCQIDLVLYDAESSSKGLDVNAGTVYAKNNVVYSNHVDPVGFAISTAKKVDLEMILIESTDETPRYLMKEPHWPIFYFAYRDIGKKAMSSLDFGRRL